MNCCVCGKVLISFNECRETWRKGSRVIICQSDECYKIYIKWCRLQYKNNNVDKREEK